MTPVVDASAYCDHCGHQHRAGSRCKIRDGYGDRCDCAGTGKDYRVDRPVEDRR